MPTGRQAPQGVGNTRQKDHRGEMNLADVTSLVNGPVLELIQWLQRQNCIPNPLLCTVCNIPMELTQRNRGTILRSQFFIYILSIEMSYQFCLRRKTPVIFHPGDLVT